MMQFSAQNSHRADTSAMDAGKNGEEIINQKAESRRQYALVVLMTFALTG